MARTKTGTAPVAKPKGKVSVAVPTELRSMLDKAAAEAKVALPDYVRQTLAATVGFTGPLTVGAGRTRKYATPEERKAAATERRKAKNALVKRLLKEHQEAKS